MPMKPKANFQHQYEKLSTTTITDKKHQHCLVSDLALPIYTYLINNIVI